MPTFLLTSGLPSYPAGLDDKEANLVTPLYRAVNALSQNISLHTGNMQYSEADLASINQLAPLINSKLNKVIVKAAVNLTYGALLNIYIDAGKLVARLATNTPGSTKPAMAILDEPSGLAADSYGTVIFMTGRSLGISDTVFGQQYYLGETGLAQSTIPTGAGRLVQQVGMGLASGGIYLSIPTQGYLI